MASNAPRVHEGTSGYVWLVWGRHEPDDESILIAVHETREGALAHEACIPQEGARGRDGDWWLEVWTTPWAVRRSL